MKVKLLANICGPEGSFLKGEYVPLSEKLANGLIAGGYALEVIEEKVVEAVEVVEEKVIEQKPSKKFGGKK